VLERRRKAIESDRSASYSHLASATIFALRARAAIQR
jgi:hypothetical protein